MCPIKATRMLMPKPSKSKFIVMRGFIQKAFMQMYVIDLRSKLDLFF